MLNNIVIFVILFVTFLVSNHVFSILTEQKVSLKKVVLFGLLFSLVNTTINFYFGIGIRSLTSNITQILLFNNIYKQSLLKTILLELLVYILSMISETIFAVIFVYLLKFPANYFLDEIIGIITVNFFILLIVIAICKINFVINIMKNIIKWYEDSKLIKFIILIVISFSLIAFFTYQNFVGIDSIVYFVEVNIALVLVFVFIIGYFNQKAKNNLILTDYDQLMEYVKTYEKVIDEKSKNQHEYKNQLILLKSMIKEKDAKSIDYINKLIEIEDKQENYQYLNKLKNIPSGGLKGFILYKIDIMLEEGITPYTYISDTLSKDEVWNICEENLQDISRAIGVYLDNAIEAAMKSKDKYVLLDIEFIDNEVIFTISNTYPKDVDISKIGKENYTTKGKNHGHGLELIKEIINKNPNLEQYRELNGIYYVQKLIIK